MLLSFHLLEKGFQAGMRNKGFKAFTVFAILSLTYTSRFLHDGLKVDFESVSWWEGSSLFYLLCMPKYLSWYSGCLDSGAGINVSLSSVEILS